MAAQRTQSILTISTPRANRLEQKLHVRGNVQGQGRDPEVGVGRGYTEVFGPRGHPLFSPLN